MRKTVDYFLLRFCVPGKRGVDYFLSSRSNDYFATRVYIDRAWSICPQKVIFQAGLAPNRLIFAVYGNSEFVYKRKGNRPEFGELCTMVYFPFVRNESLDVVMYGRVRKRLAILTRHMGAAQKYALSRFVQCGITPTKNAAPGDSLLDVTGQSWDVPG